MRISDWSSDVCSSDLLANGKPLTVTHPDIERFFMTVQEAVLLILQSSARALETDSERGTIFVLDMGEPVKIVEIARRVIRMAGLRPEIDVPIRRSEERRVGKECVRAWIYRWWPER